jgi:lipopolysaccharide/colanic/teichoic acid biosynthesis glycosyltransferase
MATRENYRVDNPVTHFGQFKARFPTIARQRAYQVVKRAGDLVFCLLALPFVILLIGLCALLIILDSPGPALFVQERIGKRGRRFCMYKLRTMQHNLDDSYHRAFMTAFVRGEIGSEEDIDGENDMIDSEKEIIYKPAHASEITRVGRFLRKTSLDELPQIINVLKGEMSLVGPRPNVPWEVEAYQPSHYQRLEVLPGITGLAQVNGRSGLRFETIVEYDLEYIAKQSAILDLKILWWTVSRTLFGTGVE